MAGEPSNLQPKNVASDDNKESQKDLQNDSDLPLEKLSLDPKIKLPAPCLGGLPVNRVHVKLSDKVQGLRPDLRDGKFVDLNFKNVPSNKSNAREKDTPSEHDQSDTIPREKLNLVPKKKLLVLGLGGLLVHRVHRKYWPRVRGLNPDVRSDKFLVFKRPFCTEFMQFCFERFEVGIWSSVTEHNIEDLLDSVTGAGMRNKLAFVWGQEECIDSGYHCLRKVEKPLFLKDLNLLWEKKYLNLPWRRGQYSSSNTLLIDDEPHTSLLNPPDTAIFPRPYKRPDSKDTFLGANGWLRSFLQGLADADDVLSYVREHRFGHPPITPSHSDWYYYSKIVREFGKEDGNKIHKEV